VIREIRSLGARIVFFVDEDIFLQPERSRALFQALIPLRVIWVAQAGIAAGDDDSLLRLARRSGCRGILLGIESLSPGSLESVGKGFNAVKTYKRRLEAFREAKIETEVSLMFGFDGEGPEVYEDSFRFLIKNRVHHMAVWPLTPLPGTELYDRLRTQGRLLEEAWWLRKDAESPRLKFTGTGMDEAEFKEKFMEFRRRFYSPARLLKRFLFPPSAQNLFGLLWSSSLRSGLED
jgi:radical SAM superfamily enzyme YgiQ (UPF0313 family)